MLFRHSMRKSGSTLNSGTRNRQSRRSIQQRNRLILPHRSKSAVFPLATLRKEPSVVEEVNSKVPPKAFEVFMTSVSARRFMGRRTVIEDIEDVVPSFYEKVGQHLGVYLFHDKKRTSARINWLLRQVKDADAENIFVKIILTKING